MAHITTLKTKSHTVAASRSWPVKVKSPKVKKEKRVGVVAQKNTHQASKYFRVWIQKIEQYLFRYIIPNNWKKKKQYTRSIYSFIPTNALLPTVDYPLSYSQKAPPNYTSLMFE